MATNFPEEIDSFLNPLSTDSVAIVSHAAQHSDTNDAIEALEAKVGKNNSTDTSSLDYKVNALNTALGNKLDSNYVTIGNTLLDGISGQTYGLIGTSEYLDVKNTNGYNKEIELDITAVESKLTVDGFALQTDISSAITALDLPNTYDAIGAADAAELDANEYTDFAVSSLGNNLPNIYVPISDIGSIDGVASLNSSGKVPNTELDIDERIQDVAAKLITDGTHTNISVSYNDQDGKISLTGSAPQLTQEEIQDYVAPLFNHSLHTNITATYDDQNNKILLTSSSTGGSLTQEEIQDFVAPLLNHAYHTNITASYDDANNRITLQSNSGSGGGASVIISPTPPPTPGLGDIWLDSDNGKTYIWDGAYWIEVGGSSSQAVAAVNSIPPSSPVLGSIWMNSSTAKTYIYDGSFWAQI